MEMPKPTEFHKKLERMAGKWTSRETLYPSPWAPETTHATGETDSRMDLDGFALITNYHQERDGAITYRGHGVFGYDSRQGCYLMVWSDSTGGVPGQATKGQWVDNCLTFQDQSEFGHIRYVYTFNDDGSYDFVLAHSKDGEKWNNFMDGHYTRDA